MSFNITQDNRNRLKKLSQIYKIYVCIKYFKNYVFYKNYYIYINNK